METPYFSKGLTFHSVDFLVSNGVSDFWAWAFAITLSLLGFFGVLFLAITVRRRLIKRALNKVTSKTEFDWDDILNQYGVFRWGANIIIALLSVLLARLFFAGVVVQGFPVFDFVTAGCYIYFIITVLFFFDSLLDGSLAFYAKLPISKDVEIKGFVQAVKLLVFLVGLIFIISVIIGETPLYILSGIGALTAILLLIFKDAILGFVAGIQISVNRTVRVGDWVEMPSHMADGDVIDISLTTVKIQNWDKTITSIPTYDLISRPFKNWRGMSESGGRRIKRSLMIDMNTIRFADEEMLKNFRSIKILEPYLDKKLPDIDSSNSGIPAEERAKNGRWITNIGTFRAYCEAYLSNHPKIHDKMTFLVRQLAPTSKGLPIEIYVFSNDTAWVSYEAIQSDIFDHLIAILPELGLAVFQEPTGRDFNANALLGS